MSLDMLRLRSYQIEPRWRNRVPSWYALILGLRGRKTGIVIERIGRVQRVGVSVSVDMWVRRL